MIDWDWVFDWITKLLLFGFVGFLLVSCVGSEVYCLTTHQLDLCPHLVKVGSNG